MLTVRSRKKVKFETLDDYGSEVAEKVDDLKELAIVTVPRLFVPLSYLSQGW